MAPISDSENIARIKIVGAGGAGCNAVNRMIQEKIKGVQYIAINTDAQALVSSAATTRIRIGDKLTKGLGVGGDPLRGQKAAEESREQIKEALQDADMVFIAAGMGGGTGTGAAPVIAEVSREVGALTVAVVTKPFSFEGTRRRHVAEEGIARLKDKVDTWLLIANDRLLGICDKNVSLEAAFRTADDVLRQAVQGISELITVPGDVNLDFADVRAIMSEAGSALMAIGRGVGEDKAVDAARAAISSPLLEISIDGATGVLLNITGGPDLRLHEVYEAADIIAKAADPDANIIWGTVTDLKMENEVKVTIIATGFAREPRTIATEAHLRQLLNFDEKEENAKFDMLDIPRFLREPRGRSYDLQTP